jgi:hypothetical protein
MRKTSLLRKIDPTAMRSGLADVNAFRTDFSIRNSERSPLHDVRQHAAALRRMAREGGRAKFCSITDEQIPAGGARRDRTDDLLLAKQALSQLSYGPGCRGLVGLGRFELPTSRLSSARSNQLSYRPRAHAGKPARLVGRPQAPCTTMPAWARPRRKRNVDGGVPPDRPEGRVCFQVIREKRA